MAYAKGARSLIVCLEAPCPLSYPYLQLHSSTHTGARLHHHASPSLLFCWCSCHDQNLGTPAQHAACNGKLVLLEANGFQEYRHPKPCAHKKIGSMGRMCASRHSKPNSAARSVHAPQTICGRTQHTPVHHPPYLAKSCHVKPRRSATFTRASTATAYCWIGLLGVAIRFLR